MSTRPTVSPGQNPGEICSLPFLVMVGAGISWLVAASLPSASLPSHQLVLLHVSLFLSYKDSCDADMGNRLVVIGGKGCSGSPGFADVSCYIGPGV